MSDNKWQRFGSAALVVAGVVAGCAGTLMCMGGGWLPTAIVAWLISKNRAAHWQNLSGALFVGVAIGVIFIIAMSAAGLLRH